MRKKVIIISNAVEDPSSYYRLIQYMEQKDNVKILNRFSKKQFRKYFSSKCRVFTKMMIACSVMLKTINFVLWDYFIFKSDEIIINRKVFPHYCPHCIRFLLKKYLSERIVIWDFDDNIIYGKEIHTAELKIYEDTVDEVVVTNKFLKKTLNWHLQQRTLVLPTTDKRFENYDLITYNKQRIKEFYSKVNFIWIGTGGNLQFLKQIIKQLDNIAKKNEKQKIILYNICNEKLIENTKYLQIKNVVWSRENVMRYLRKAHIGLMPLEDNEFTRGKGAFKAIQYMGAGIPVVASPVGYNNYVIEQSVNGFFIQKDWEKNIEKVMSDVLIWEKLSFNARKTWKDKFDSKYNQIFWNHRV